MTAITVSHRGVLRRLVVRRYKESEWLRREPDLAAREAKVLQLLERERDLRTPGFVAVDPTGRDAGSPTVLMTRLHGHTEWEPPSVERLAAVAPLVHAVTPPRNFRRYRPYYDVTTKPMFEWQNHELWERAYAVASAATVDRRATCFIHRDHHAGNVLWSHGRVTGIVDWVEACVGPPAIDSARARMNLAARLGLDAARRYAKQPGVVVDPVWDLVDASDCGPSGLPGPYGHSGLEDFVADALSELG